MSEFVVCMVKSPDLTYLPDAAIAGLCHLFGRTYRFLNTRGRFLESRRRVQ